VLAGHETKPKEDSVEKPEAPDWAMEFADRLAAMTPEEAEAVATFAPGPGVPPDPDAELLRLFPPEATDAQMDTDAWQMRHGRRRGARS